MATKTVQKQENTSVEEKLLALSKLQGVLTEIDKIRILRGELPEEVEDLENEVVGLNTRADRFRKESGKIDELINGYRHEIEENAIQIEKYKTQQNNVTNDKEFEYLGKELEYKGLENQLAEKKIKECQIDKERKEKEIESVEEILKDKTEILNQKKEELNKIIEDTKKEEEEKLVEAKRLEADVNDDRLLTAFKRIRQNAANGLAVVGIDRDACGGCFNKIPAQRQLDVKSRKKIIVCEYCGRILVDSNIGKPIEEIEAEAEAKAEKKTTRKRAATTRKTTKKAE